LSFHLQNDWPRSGSSRRHVTCLSSTHCASSLALVCQSLRKNAGRIVACGSSLLRSWTRSTIWIVAVSLWLLVGCCSGDQDAKRLYEDLLTDYNRLIRPVGNNSDRLTVRLGLKLSQLIDVVSRQWSSRPKKRERRREKKIMIKHSIENVRRYKKWKDCCCCSPVAMQ
jgi:Neurotransmitter-gated ion-channel ligand binding domain